MELKQKIEHYMHFITDQNENKWKVVETSDLEDIMESYHQAKLKLLGITIVSEILGYFEKLGDKYYISEIDGNMLKGWRLNHLGISQTMSIHADSTDNLVLSSR